MGAVFAGFQLQCNLTIGQLKCNLTIRQLQCNITLVTRPNLTKKVSENVVPVPCEGGWMRGDIRQTLLSKHNCKPYIDLTLESSFSLVTKESNDFFFLFGL